MEMQGHISKKILISFFQSGVGSKKTDQIAEHMNSCPFCKKNLDVLGQITSATPDNNLKPKKSVLSNINSFYDTLTAQAVAEPQQSVSLWMPRFRLAGAAFLILCAGVLIYTISWHFQFENATMRASRVKGLVKVDTLNLHKGQTLYPGVILTTGDNSKLVIIYGTTVKLNAGPHTRIYITKSRIDKNTGKIYFEMVVEKGVIMAVFDKSGNLAYTLKTPHGAVSSNGSTIAMEVDSSKTRVVVKEGSANLSSTYGRSVNSEEGAGYTITTRGVTPAVNSSSDDEQDNNSILNNSALIDLMDDDPDDDTSVQ
jgi:hypothetical protein